MSIYTPLNKTALTDLALERGIDLEGATTNAMIVALLEAYDEKNPTTTEQNTQTTKTPDTIQVPVKTLEKAVKEEGQVFAGVTVYGDQAGISAELGKHPTVRIMIPLMEGEPKGTTQFIGLNGATFHVTKGKMVELPQPLAEIIDNSYQLDLGDVEKLELSNVPQQLQ